MNPELRTHFRMTSIETATLSDLPSVQRINALLRIDVEDFYWDAAPYVESAIRQRRCFLIREEGSILGCMILEKRPPDGSFGRDHLAIGTLSVLPECRRRNCGAELVEYAKAVGRNEGKRLYVESFYEFRKKAYYRALGFTETTPGRYRGKPYHVLYVDPPR